MMVLVKLVGWWVLMAVVAAVITTVSPGQAGLIGLGWLVVLLWGSQRILRRRRPIGT